MKTAFETTPFETGSVSGSAGGKATESIAWTPHPAFAGVSMKHLVTGADTNGTSSVHLVRVNPGCCIGDHIHNGKTEIHQVVAGVGRCLLEEREIAYAEGVVAVIPADRPHSVFAGESGLFLLAVFSPALL